MAKIPGTDIDKPTVDLAGIDEPSEKLRKVKRALRAEGAPGIVVEAFRKAAMTPHIQYELDTVIAQYVEVA